MSNGCDNAASTRRDCWPEFSARQLGVAVAFDCLLRACWTEPQTRLNREERLHNVKDAFLVADAGKVKGRRILIVDDVFTTGTTLNECAKTLKAAGAAAVHAVTISRALPLDGSRERTRDYRADAEAQRKIVIDPCYTSRMI